MSCFVTVSISPAGGGATTTRVLGEFGTVWRKGVSIGSDERCDIRLPGLAPVAAIVHGVSNHKVLYRGAWASLADANESAGGPNSAYDARVDYSAFEVGAYRVQFAERYDAGET